MSTQKMTFSGAVHLLPRTLVALAVAAVVTGCSVTPKAVTADEVRDRVKSDTAKMYVDQAPINAPIAAMSRLVGLSATPKPTIRCCRVSINGPRAGQPAGRSQEAKRDGGGS